MNLLRFWYLWDICPRQKKCCHFYPLQRGICILGFALFYPHMSLRAKFYSVLRVFLSGWWRHMYVTSPQIRQRCNGCRWSLRWVKLRGNWWTSSIDWLNKSSKKSNMPLNFFITITCQTDLIIETSYLKKQAIDGILLQHLSDKRQAPSWNRWYANVPTSWQFHIFISPANIFSELSCFCASSKDYIFNYMY